MFVSITESQSKRMPISRLPVAELKMHNQSSEEEAWQHPRSVYNGEGVLCYINTSFLYVNQDLPCFLLKRSN